ncbi:uncharacterized protein EI90DRAFT_2286405 [Cantharellus anzutake]|uniref:uncharacterized protein n=1 Tax=Cantharellus anzutake TaxID=1750568 RepID=UPI00190392A0|nr:uncharacterized protein EI90DRAFT_2286405 [Cantharellus anzutake]KAF8339805.1 hypothetical protein EI90DRAFT_2286405 [Cantharellus anzutake]
MITADMPLPCITCLTWNGLEPTIYSSSVFAYIHTYLAYSFAFSSLLYVPSLVQSSAASAFLLSPNVSNLYCTCGICAMAPFSFHSRVHCFYILFHDQILLWFLEYTSHLCTNANIPHFAYFVPPVRAHVGFFIFFVFPFSLRSVQLESGVGSDLGTALLSVVFVLGVSFRPCCTMYVVPVFTLGPCNAGIQSPHCSYRL